MAPLASIPEVNTPLSGSHDDMPLPHRRTASFERLRPRSRVVVLSRRPARVRRSFCPPHQPRGLRPAHSHRVHPPYHDLCHDPSRRDDASRRPGGPQAAARWAPDPAAWSHQTPDSTLSSVDLDSFPLPPSSNMAQQPRAHTGHLTTETPSRLAAPHMPPASSTRPHHAGRLGASSRRRAIVDAATDIATTSKHSSVDSALVEAISRTVIQQLRLFSAIKQGKHAFRLNKSSSPHSHTAQPRACSQREALDRFTRDLCTYADNTGAKGRTVHSTPVSTARSGETLNTVSALLPFRPEFRAAGLAVTSKDQAWRRAAQGPKDCTRRRLDRCPPVKATRRPRLPQLDGPRAEAGSSTNTEISFAPSRDVDALRYALIEEVPTKKRGHRRVPRAKKPRNHCLPCLPGEDDPTTDTEWAHFRPPPADSAPRQKPPAGPRSRMPLQARPLPPPPLPPPPPPPPPPSMPTSIRHTRGLSSPPSPHDRYSHARVERKSVRAESCREHRAGHQQEAAKGDCRFPAKGGPADGEEPFRATRADASRGYRTGAKPRPLRAQSDRARLVREVKTFERQLLSPRPYQNLPIQDAVDAARNNSLRATVASAPDDHFAWKQGGTVSSLEEELEAAAQAVAGVRVSPDGKQPAQTHGRQDIPPALYDPNHVGFCCRAGRGVPSRATAPPNIPRRTSSMRGSSTSVDMGLDDGAIEDRDVLRGLHVAASAACDEEVDAFVRNRTGLRIRRFLADLMVLEAFGEPRPGEDSEKRAKRRRAEMRKLKKHVRRSREMAMNGGLI